MEHVLACIDASVYSDSVCDLSAWAAHKLDIPIELLHVVQRHEAVSERHDLSGAIGLGAKSVLLEELTKLEEADSRLQVERGRALLAVATERLKAAGITRIDPLHRHGGIIETILEREEGARVVIIGKRGADHAFAADHIGSMVERVVRASTKPVLIASRHYNEPQSVVLAYDGSKHADHALERLRLSALFTGMPVHIVMAGSIDGKHRAMLDKAAARLDGSVAVTTTLQQGKPEKLISDVVAATPGALLVMGAYGHSPFRTLIVGSTTTAMIRTVHAPVLLVR
ncbi:universal stress protein [Blastomonas sp.]|uniref:universal stress protein n=1 Tax=Blastomonas sp. TaxID=1909299 RepID=UPI003592E952